MYLTWFIHTYDMAYWYTWHDSFTYMTWLIGVFAITHEYLWRAALVCTHFLFLWMDSETRPYIWHDTIIYVKWLIHIRDVTPCCMGDESFTNESFHICINSTYIWLRPVTNMEMTHSYSWHDAIIYRQSFLVFWTKHKIKKEVSEDIFGLHAIHVSKFLRCECVMSHTRMSHT